MAEEELQCCQGRAAAASSGVRRSRAFARAARRTATASSTAASAATRTRWRRKASRGHGFKTSGWRLASDERRATRPQLGDGFRRRPRRARVRDRLARRRGERRRAAATAAARAWACAGAKAGRHGGDIHGAGGGAGDGARRAGRAAAVRRAARRRRCCGPWDYCVSQCNYTCCCHMATPPAPALRRPLIREWYDRCQRGVVPRHDVCPVVAEQPHSRLLRARHALLAKA